MNILDLPENFFRSLFYFFDDKDVFFTIRNVTQLLKIYVDGYIQLEAKLFFVNEELHAGSLMGYDWAGLGYIYRILYIFRRFDFSRRIHDLRISLRSNIFLSSLYRF